MRQFFAVSVVLWTLFALGEQAKPKYRITSVISLLANPSKAHETLVQTEGFLRFEHRSAFIYLDEVSAQNGLIVNALPIEIGQAKWAAVQEKCKEKYVAGRGRFV